MKLIGINKKSQTFYEYTCLTALWRRKVLHYSDSDCQLLRVFLGDVWGTKTEEVNRWETITGVLIRSRHRKNVKTAPSRKRLGGYKHPVLKYCFV